ncbi:MAG: flagellar biosynthesis protein FlhF [Bdellovibrionaceae bacterium]|nr:flagellar biosynthesis protein FlhF [Pseudobdellovibrionaceae bacterium]
MLVKKFEARTMKEALEMVKAQMGPDAIILSARDNKKSFGLVGEVSVEITAAVSETTLHKKKFVENKMIETDKEKFQKSPARSQKDLIEKMVRRELESRPVAKTNLANTPQPEPKAVPRKMTSQRYIEIDETDEFESSPQQPQSQTQLPVQSPAQSVAQPPVWSNGSTIKNLRTEVSSLKEALSHFQKIPQQLGSSYPGADFGLPFDLSFLFVKMVKEGVSEKIVGQLLYEAFQKMPPNRIKNQALVEGWVAKNILETTVLSPLDFNTKVHVFFGPAGGGKTTTLVKMASRLLLEENKRVGLITTDILKVGAIDQLRIFSQILNVPFAVVREPSDWRKLASYFDQVDVLFVDFPALGLREFEQVHKWAALLPPTSISSQKHLVLPCTYRSDDMKEAATRWEAFRADDLIITNLDESVRRGVVYSIMKELGLPLFAFGIGSRVPDDFEYATKERVLDLIFRITEQQVSDHSGSERWKE